MLRPPIILLLLYHVNKIYYDKRVILQLYLPKHNGNSVHTVFFPFRHNSPSVPIPRSCTRQLLPRAQVTNLKPLSLSLSLSLSATTSAAVEYSPRRLFYFYSRVWVCVMCECARSIDCARRPRFPGEIRCPEMRYLNEITDCGVEEMV